MAKRVNKWKCSGCGFKAKTKREVQQHIKRQHQTFISRTGGLGSIRYHPKKIEKKP